MLLKCVQFAKFLLYNLILTKYVVKIREGSNHNKLGRGQDMNLRGNIFFCLEQGKLQVLKSKTHF